MRSSGGPISSYRRYWLPELAVLAALAASATVLFSVTGLDIAAASRFYHPEFADPWPAAKRPLWSLFYRSAPWVTGSLAVTGVALLVAGTTRDRWRRLRLHGVFLLLCVIVGPGLIVNGILKDHWGRPRPRQIVEFGGRLPYAPPLLPAGTPGKSFPCGHCSVGYLYAAGWWVWIRRRPLRAAGSLAAGLATGSLLGIGRMAAGGHFLSDIVWSGLIAFGVAHVLYYYVLRVPAREDSLASLFPWVERNPRRKAAAIAAVVLLGAAVVVGGILASPQHADLSVHIRPSDLPAAPETAEVIVDTLDVEIVLVTGPPGEIECTGTIRGFGLPTNEIRAAWEFRERPVPTWAYRITQKGWFTDIDGVARIRLPVRNLRRITVRVGRGDIRIFDATGGRQEAEHLPTLDLHTGDGRVKRS